MFDRFRSWKFFIFYKNKLKKPEILTRSSHYEIWKILSPNVQTNNENYFLQNSGKQIINNWWMIWKCSGRKVEFNRTPLSRRSFWIRKLKITSRRWAQSSTGEEFKNLVYRQIHVNQYNLQIIVNKLFLWYIKISIAIIQ